VGNRTPAGGHAAARLEELTRIEAAMRFLEYALVGHIDPTEDELREVARLIDSAAEFRRRAA